MKTDFLNETRPVYVSVNKDGFGVNGKTFPQIQCVIKAVAPVRKLFNGAALECYSNDAEKGKNGEFCSICSRKTRCRRRIRLMILILGQNRETPAQLEINSNSFEPLKKLLEPIGEEELPETVVSITVSAQGKYLQVLFNPIF